ncbi:dienelactone hydrolase family protein [Rhizobium sp. CSW-27]|uniref:dienelactone hydrolase family protein n=1 Tax=Rhizobium sp. CSW-27 TaxID=2839985 RepID=UPI001C0308DF|nr:dienelactone hydrolase family protein [Rhizobium sp. CSW-27]MBT9372961.1 dienelactone hydrolase family protein [Rhizobium sp. CSW-27]
MKRILIPVILFALPAFAQKATSQSLPDTYATQQRQQSFATSRLNGSQRDGQWVSLQLKDRTLRAFLRYPNKEIQSPVPIVIVLHEVFGLTDSTRNTADRISEMGYLTITPDMVSGLAPNGGGVEDFSNSRQTAEVVTGQLHANVVAQINAWARYGLNLPQSNGKLAVVGLSWGGGAAFRYAVSADHHPALKAAFSFYDVGPPVFNQGPNRANNPPMDISAMDVPVYGFYPTNDLRVMDSLPTTIEAMRAAEKLFFPEIYEGADHGYMRLGEDPANENVANKTALYKSLDRLKAELKNTVSN